MCQFALDNPFTIDHSDGAAETSEGKQFSDDQVIAVNPFTDGLNAAKRNAEKLWHADREYPDIRMNFRVETAYLSTGRRDHSTCSRPASCNPSIQPSNQ